MTGSGFSAGPAFRAAYSNVEIHFFRTLGEEGEEKGVGSVGRARQPLNSWALAHSSDSARMYHARRRSLDHHGRALSENSPNSFFSGSVVVLQVGARRRRNVRSSETLRRSPQALTAQCGTSTTASCPWASPAQTYMLPRPCSSELRSCSSRSWLAEGK